MCHVFSFKVCSIHNLLLYFDVNNLTTPVLCLKPVPHSPYRFYVLRLRSIKFNLFPDLFDMNRDGRNIADGFHIPDFTEQFVFFENAVRMFLHRSSIIFFTMDKYIHSILPLDISDARFR